MRAFIYSAFLFRNGQDAQRGRMNRMLRMMAGGEMSAADSNTSLPKKK